MSDYRQDQPPQELMEMLFYKDGALYWKPEYCKRGRKENKPIGCVDRCGYLNFTNRKGEPENKTRCYKVHRVIYLLEKGEWPPIVDHKDRNTLNNDISNLRASQHGKNQQNRKKQRNNKTGYMGVYSRNGGYSISVNVAGKNFGISGYKTAIQAALARDLLAHWIYGETANLNILGKYRIKVGGVEMTL
ncbi:HNH endonuclease [Salmonella enterica]|nr:HNH endonuclease [Salmonella enterica]EMD5616185.1 HNH endonuclease [Salmonella enterica]